MKLILRSIAVLSLTAAVPLAPSFAQTAGQQVIDTSGAAVGTVVRVDGGNVIVKTDKHEVALPKTSFTPNEGKLLFGMTQAQLNAEVEKSLAAANASIAAGATVQGLGGTDLGKIEAVDSGNVTIALQSGKKFQVSATSLRGNADGTVTIGYTAEQLDALVKGSEGAQSGGK